MKKNLENTIQTLDKTVKTKKLDFPELKREIDDLVSTQDQFSSFKPLLFEEEEFKNHTDALLQLKLLCSQLREKAEINEKLESLAYYLGQLRYSLFLKDKKMLKKIMGKFLEDEQTNLHDLLGDIQRFRQELETLQGTYQTLHHEVPLDIWVKHASYLESQVKTFQNIHERQKNIAVNIGRLFVNLAKKEFKK